MIRELLEQDTVIVAEKLIGCHLVRRTKNGLIRVQITETEAYRGSDDPASHASARVTPRNKLMFGEVGRIYVYMIYGMHYCMNVIAHKSGEVGAVLIRAGEAVEGIELIRSNRPKADERSLLNGPAKLAQAMNVDLSLNGHNLLQNPGGQLDLEINTVSGIIRRTPRIGITKATELPWRFMLESRGDADPLRSN